MISVPQENEKEAYPGKEKTPFLTLGTDFAKDIYTKFKTRPRVVKVFLVNIDGESVFIPRFLSPMQPPMEADADGGFPIWANDAKAVERAARFVSLIPFVDDTQLFKDMPDLTCTSQEFLDLGAGDSEEHAMLLCNYFNFIDLEQGRQKKGDQPTASGMDIHSYIVYGEAVPDGDCWFVARRCKAKGYMELWNPMTAECYNFDRIETSTKQAVGADAKSTSTNMRLFDPTCTMKRVWCIVGQENIWANI